MKELIVIEKDVSTWAEAIKTCGQELKDNGYVEDGFSEDCIKRELDYPTGILSSTSFAIPHSDGEHVIRDGLCVLRTEKPVTFHRMDDIESTIETRIVVNLAIKRGSDHIDVLKNLMMAMLDDAFAERCLYVEADELIKMFADRGIKC